MFRSVILGIAVTAAVVAAVPATNRFGGWLDPYHSRFARRLLYFGGGIALALYVVLVLSR